MAVQGRLWKDPKFKTYLDGATKAGLKVGVYFYTQAITTAEAKAEAKFVLDRIKGYSLQSLFITYQSLLTMTLADLTVPGLSKAQRPLFAQLFATLS